MNDLRVRIQLHGTIVEDRTIVVRDRVQLGASRFADVHFPGADLIVRRVGPELEVRGRTLREGVPISITLGGVEVTLEAVSRREDKLAREVPMMDLRVLVATVALALTGSFVDAVVRFVEQDPIANDVVAELIAPDWAARAQASIRAPERLPEGVAPAPALELPLSGDGTEVLPVRFELQDPE